MQGVQRERAHLVERPLGASEGFGLTRVQLLELGRGALLTRHEGARRLHRPILLGTHLARAIDEVSGQGVERTELPCRAGRRCVQCIHGLLRGMLERLRLQIEAHRLGVREKCRVHGEGQRVDRLDDHWLGAHVDRHVIGAFMRGKTAFFQMAIGELHSEPAPPVIIQ